MTDRGEKQAFSKMFDEASSLCRSPMMSRLLNAMLAGEDVGDHGRFVFLSVARHFLPEHEIVELFAAQPGFNDRRAKACLLSVQNHNLRVPTKAEIADWQKNQSFALLPESELAGSEDIYRELEFPEGEYGDIPETLVASFRAE